MVRRCIGLFLLLFGGIIFSAAQSITGLPPLATLQNQGIDTINVANLNAFVSIPVVNKPDPGFAFNYSLSYNSSVFSPSCTTDNHNNTTCK